MTPEQLKFLDELSAVETAVTNLVKAGQDYLALRMRMRKERSPHYDFWCQSMQEVENRLASCMEKVKELCQ